VRFDLNDEQKAIADSVSALLQKGLPETELVARFDRQALDEPLWRDVAELGTGGILVPAEQGGLGLDLLTLAQVAEQVGHYGASVPAVGNALVDALSVLGIDEVPMPATPEKLWRAIREARR